MGTDASFRETVRGSGGTIGVRLPGLGRRRREHYTADGHAKIAYRSRDLAVTAAARLRREGRDVVPYECRRCGEHHLGNRRYPSRLFRGEEVETLRIELGLRAVGILASENTHDAGKRYESVALHASGALRKREQRYGAIV